MATWADWVDRILSEGDWNVAYLSEAPPEPFPFERRKALAERKPIRSRLENLSPVKSGAAREGRKHEVSEEVDRILENLTRPETVYFQRIDLPVSAFLLFAKDPEEYFRVYEIGSSPPTGKRLLEVKEEEPQEEEGISRAEFGTRVHQILERALRRRTSVRDAEELVSRFVQDLGEKQAQEILEIVTHFLQTREAEEILKAGRLHPELPFVLRLPQGLIHGTMDLLYQNSKGEWVILDYKTSEVDEETFTERGEDYRVQLELYALAASQILGQPPREARIHFLRRGLTHRITFQAKDFEKLSDKFSSLQKGILAFRRSRIVGAPTQGRPHRYFS
jgi:ATP-dependent exoDNAse (exonuclease V) beta subunit